MSNRYQRNIYCFLSDENGKFIQAVQQTNGSYIISRTNAYGAKPIKFNPDNLLNSPFEFATNQKYLSLVRTISYPLNFVKDGAAILRNEYYNKKVINQNTYLTVIEWDGDKGYYVLSYKGKIDYSQKNEDPKTGSFTVNTVDDSAWGALSQNDDVEFAIDCSRTNPKAIKILIDGITLLNKATFQTVQAAITDFNADNVHIIPFVLVNQDGDSAGVVFKNQTSSTYSNFPASAPTATTWFMNTAYALNNVNIAGSFIFTWSSRISRSGGLIIYFYTSRGQKVKIFDRPTGGTLIAGQIYKVDFDFNLNLQVAESIFFVAEMNDNAANLFTITPIVTNVAISTKTKSQPQIVFGLRAIDLLQQLVEKATKGRFTINSDYFTAFNKDIIVSGDAVRGLDNAKIYTSFYEFFKSFNSLYFMALQNRDGNLYIEKATSIYPQNPVIIDLGEVIDVKITSAEEYYVNEIVVGSPKQDYRHPSGRLEFNSENKFSVNLQNIKNSMDLVSKYRLDCYGVQFLILDYQGQSTQDNSGDKENFVIAITDEKATAVEDIETFENVTVDNAVLEPIIKSPLTNDTINYNKPTIRGIAIPLANVNIYVDTVLDGGTTTDANGDWTYEINTAMSGYNPGVADGIHIVEATFTDLSAPTTAITITIDETVSCVTKITYPQQADSLYNNKPLIKGVAQNGTNIDVFLDGILIGSVVTNNSCKWELQSPLITNANHTLVVGVNSVNFDVDARVAFPLITYVGSELDGFLIVNNLPLIKGVALPFAVVTLWLNYISYSPLGSVTADANGNWQYQVVPVNYTDPSSGIPVILAPIRNGLNVISTSLVNHTVGINVTGYKLNRPAYSSITGVIDNTVFNTLYSPKRMLMNHAPMLSAIMKKQPLDVIEFQKADKNGNLRTVLGTTIIAENANVPVSSLGNPIALLEKAIIKTKTLTSFAKTLEAFVTGGVIKTTFRGSTLYCLPIGSMKIESIVSDIQEWTLLFSPQTTYNTLLNLYKNGLILNLMQNTIYHSDYNTLHFVTYNFIQSNKYNFKTIYDDWYNNRNDAWLYNPDYIQKLQFDDVFKDQIISNGVSSLTLRAYTCKEAQLVDTFIYNPVVPAPIPIPEVVLEAIVDMSPHPEGQYFFVLAVDGEPVAISERVEYKEKWLGTVLIEAKSSINQVGSFFSTGFKSILRVEGLVKKLQPSTQHTTAVFEEGSTENLWSDIAKKRTIRYGTAYGLPDYLYLKCAAATLLDDFKCEGINYTLDQDQEIEPSEDVAGHPLYFYNINVHLQENSKGKMFPGDDGADLNGVVLVVDSDAVGLPGGSLININLNN